MHSLSPIHPIRLSGKTPRAGHSLFGYSANTIFGEVALTSEHLRNWVTLDSGASSHFLLLTAPVLNKMVAERPLTLTFPNGDTVRLSHMAELDLHLLPRKGGGHTLCLDWHLILWCQSLSCAIPDVRLIWGISRVRSSKRRKLSLNAVKIRVRACGWCRFQAVLGNLRTIRNKITTKM